MISEGQIVLFTFPQTNHQKSKLRPTLVLRKLPGKFDDWLICMISSRLHQKSPEVDEMITPDDTDFQKSGLKVSSVIRASRLAVVDSEILIGKLGQIDQERLIRIKGNIAKWIKGA